MTRPTRTARRVVAATVSRVRAARGRASARARRVDRAPRRALPRRRRRRQRALPELVHLEPGEAIYLGAGNLHAYLEGVGRRDHGELRQRAPRRPHEEARRRPGAAARPRLRRRAGRAARAARDRRARSGLRHAGDGVPALSPAHRAGPPRRPRRRAAPRSCSSARTARATVASPTARRRPRSSRAAPLRFVPASTGRYALDGEADVSTARRRISLDYASMRAWCPSRCSADPEATRRTIGIVLYVLGMLVGGFLLVAMLFFPALFSQGRRASRSSAHAHRRALRAADAASSTSGSRGSSIATIPSRGGRSRWRSRGAASPRAGSPALVNTIVHVFGERASAASAFGDVMSACISAPLVEEWHEGVRHLLHVLFHAAPVRRRRRRRHLRDVRRARLRRGREHPLLRQRGQGRDAPNKEGCFVGTFVVRGILAPWGHPLYTSMTGLGFGIARETNKTWLKWLAPIGGYCSPRSSTRSGTRRRRSRTRSSLLMLPLWFLFVLGFFGARHLAREAQGTHHPRPPARTRCSWAT